MKTKRAILLVLGLMLAIGAKAQLLFDDFNAGAVNSNLWTLSLPFGSSQAFQTNGRAVMIARGAFDAKQSFPTSIEVKGRFKFTGTEDFFQVVIRSDLALAPTYAEKYGIQIKFSDNGQNVRIVEYSPTNIVDIAPLTLFNFVGNTDYDFRITDDGNTVRCYITNSTTPFLEGSSLYRAGNKFSMYNREFGNSRSEVDFIQVNPFQYTNSLGIFLAIELEYLTHTNKTFYIEASPDLTTWTNFDGPFVGNGNYWSKTYSTRGNGKLFYRANEP